MAIQTATGKFWRTADSGEIVLRRAQEPGGVERFTIHWLRPDHSQAFIQSSNGRFVTSLSNPPDAQPDSVWLAADDDQPSVFKTDRVEDSESWIEFATGRGFVGVDADSRRVRLSAYELLALPHLLISAAGEGDITHPVPPPAALTVPQPASSAPSVRRFKGHTNVICAVVFTPGWPTHYQRKFGWNDSILERREWYAGPYDPNASPRHVAGSFERRQNSGQRHDRQRGENLGTAARSKDYASQRASSVARERVPRRRPVQARWPCSVDRLFAP